MTSPATLSVPCPVCGAVSGQKCYRPIRAIFGPHKQRTEAALDLLTRDDSLTGLDPYGVGCPECGARSRRTCFDTGTGVLLLGAIHPSRAESAYRKTLGL